MVILMTCAICQSVLRSISSEIKSGGEIRTQYTPLLSLRAFHSQRDLVGLDWLNDCGQRR